ncbi:unnamed protein product [Linum tenue]|uniref:F-box associated beta-propeller type 3 domain-containing protein n=2 Tax=Linum tenue TaxID=586396 RepID=A0AAV0PFG7_9ROSI|nr:unnamed protein product [Linum tenue]
MESPIQKLPKAIFHDILSSQPIQTLLESKLVSRSWLASINDPAFHNLHFSTADESEVTLFLLAFSDWPKPKLQLAELGATEEDTAKTVKITTQLDGSMLPDFDLVGSCNGILCLYSTVSDDPLYIYNPFSSSAHGKELPKLTVHDTNTICRVVFGFGFHSRTKQYKVVKVVYYKQSEYDFSGGNPEAFVLTLGTDDDEWRRLGRIAYVLAGPASEATVECRLHWKSWNLGDEGVVSFDLETEEFQVVPGPKDCSSFDHLVNLRGNLSDVELSSDGSVGVWVMRRYCVKESWSKEFAIPSHVPRSYSMEGGAPPTRRKKNGIKGRSFKVLWEFKDGKVLFLYRSKCVVVYDQVSGGFEDVCIRGLPQEFQAFVHMGTLISMDPVSNTQHRA